MSEQHQANGKFMAGFFLGGLLGAILLFFLGTKEGKKTGKIFEKKGRDALDQVQEKLEELEEKKDDLAEGAADKLDDALSQIEELQEKSIKTTAHLRRMFKNIPKKR